MDSRGQAVTIGRMIAAVVGVAGFYIIMSAAFVPMENLAYNQTTNSTATTGLDWTTYVFRYFLLIVLATVVLGAIATSVFQRRFS